MINSQVNPFSSGFGGEDIDFRELKAHQLTFTKLEGKQQIPNSPKTPNSVHPGSSSNSNSSTNGVYVDMGKVLLEAAKTGNTEKIQECVKNGAPFITDWLGTSALHIAAKNNYYDTCATLLRSGISKDAKTKVDRTPLHFAVFEGHFEICQLLIQHKCAIDPLDTLKMTPLHWAVDRGFDNIAELLLENGANPYLVSKFLKTPYSIAKEKGNDFIVKIIEVLPKPEGGYAKSSEETSSGTPLPVLKPIKRERIQSYEDPDAKRQRSAMTDANIVTLQLLKEQMGMIANAEDNLIQSALQSGRKIMLSEAGKLLLNESNLNKFLKIPLNTTISSTPPPGGKKTVSPRSATVTSRRTSEGSDLLEVYRDGTTAGGSGVKKEKPDILDIIRSSSDLQEVTITQRPKNSPVPSPTLKTNTSVSLSAINVPKAKQQSPPTVEYADVTGRQFAELSNNHQQLKRAFEREQQKTLALQRQLKQLEVNFENYRRQQNEKFESVLKLLTGAGRFGNAKEEDDDIL